MMAQSKMSSTITITECIHKQLQEYSDTALNRRAPKIAEKVQSFLYLEISIFSGFALPDPQLYGLFAALYGNGVL